MWVTGASGYGEVRVGQCAWVLECRHVETILADLNSQWRYSFSAERL